MSGYDSWARYYDLIYGRWMDYDSQCAYLRALFEELGVPEDGRVLDLGCGTGGHAIPLARMGYHVTGADSSEPMVAIAREKAADLPVEFLHQDMRELSLAGRFDAAICMFGGFGHITVTADVRRALRGIHSRLKRDSPFIFEHWLIGGTKSEHKASEEVERDGLRVVRHAHSVFDSLRNTLHIAFRFNVYENGELVDDIHSESPMRIYEPGEMEELLARAGFEPERALDSEGLYKKDVVATLLSPVKHDTFRVLCVALAQGKHETP
jgi:SAM-dependent methyltransferase